MIEVVACDVNGTELPELGRRYQDRATPWFDVTIFSPAEMEELLVGTGWRARRTLPGRVAGYVAILDRI